MSKRQELIQSLAIQEANNLEAQTVFNEITSKTTTVFKGSIRCDICSSEDIVETREGFVCRDCGICLEMQRLVYHPPHNILITQNDILRYYTMIGTPNELKNSPFHRQLARLQKHQQIVKNKKEIQRDAKIEISRIFSFLKLFDGKRDHVYRFFKEIRDQIKPGTKYRAVEKLIPLSIYFWCKNNNISINEQELLKISRISKKDFRAFKLVIYNYLADYKNRTRKPYIIQKIYELTESFKLDMNFYYTSKEILYKLWDILKITKDDVIAGVVMSITTLCLFERQILVSDICKKLGIRPSTIQFQVKNRIINRFKIKGFTSLVKSRALLKEIMIKLGLIKEMEVIKENVRARI